MGKIILITGGARCGKSSFAEDYVKTHGQNIAYIRHLTKSMMMRWLIA